MVQSRNPLEGLLRSRKFLLLVMDTVISLVLFFVARYGGQDVIEQVEFVIVSIQPVFIALIGAIAWEDAAEKRGA